MRTRSALALTALALATVGTSLSATGTVSAASAGPGSLDTSFNAGGAGANDEVEVVAFGANDTVYIAGKFTTYNGTAVPGFARLKSDGTLDASFNLGTGPDDSVEAVAEMPDGDVYVAGGFDNFNGKKADRLVRLNSDGSVDEAFVSAGFKHLASQINGEYPRTILPTSDGKIIVSGYWDQYGGTYSDGGDGVSGAVKLNADGTIDDSFTARFIGQSFTTGYATKLLYNADKSKITAIGSFFGYSSAGGNDAVSITRFDNTGLRDSTFTVTDVAHGPNNFVRGLEQTSDGKYYVMGSFTKWFDADAKYFIRLNADGTRDTAFVSPNPLVMPNNIGLDSSNRIYAAGAFASYNGTAAKGLVRLKADGTVDTTFDTSNGAAEVTAQASAYTQSTYVAVSPTDKVYVYGPLTSWGGTTIGHIGRVNTVSAPAKVKDVSVSVKGNDATVSWKLDSATGDKPDTITATASEVSTSGVRSSASSLSCTVPGTETSCTIKGLVAGKKYTFKVTTSNDAGTSAPVASSPVTVGTASSGASTPSGSLPATGAPHGGALTAIAFALMTLGTLLRRRTFARG